MIPKNGQVNGGQSATWQSAVTKASVVFVVSTRPYPIRASAGMVPTMLLKFSFLWDNGARSTAPSIILREALQRIHEARNLTFMASLD